MGAKSKLYEYAIIHHPRPKKTKEGEDSSPVRSVLVKNPTTTLATDDKEVAILAARQIPEDLLNELDRVEIVVRPF